MSANSSRRYPLELRAATKLSVTRIAAALRRAGRSRNIAATAAEIQAELRKPQLRQPRLVETAMGKQALALLAALDTACTNVAELGEAAAELFRQHPRLHDHHQFPRSGRLDRFPGAR